MSVPDTAQAGSRRRNQVKSWYRLCGKDSGKALISLYQGGGGGVRARRRYGTWWQHSLGQYRTQPRTCVAPYRTLRRLVASQYSGHRVASA
eukprot:2917109-Rhodomonas_salina.1